MNIDGIFLRQIIQTMRKDLPFRINRITQPDQYSLFINGYSQTARKLLISIDPRQNSVHWTKHNPNENLHASPKLMLFRKHLENGWIEDIKQIGTDRTFYFAIQNRNDLGELVNYKLFVELLGRFTNIILCDETMHILEAFRHQSDFESSNRIVLPGQKYELPGDDQKKQIENLTLDRLHPHFYEDFEGVSPLLSKEIIFRVKQGESIEDILKALKESETLFYYPSGQAHVIALTHLLEEPILKVPLIEGLDEIYEKENQLHQISLRKKRIQNQMRRDIKREKKRLTRLQEDLEKAENADIYRQYGDLLYTYMTDLKSGHQEIELLDFEGNKQTIPLKVHLSGKGNAKDYYKRYQKAKRSLDHLDREIKKSKDRLNYFETILSQSEWADLESLDEMIDELEEAHILKKQKRPIAKKHKKAPSYLEIKMDQYRIFIGRNNKQNEYVSFKIAKKEDLWFHVANAPGSHVVLKTDEDITDEMIQNAAMLAAHFSKKRLSHKVEVHYLKAKNLEKIKGASAGMVKMKDHHSIIVEIDEKHIQFLLKNML